MFLFNVLVRPPDAGWRPYILLVCYLLVLKLLFSQTAKRPGQKHNWGIGSAWKIHSDVLPIPSCILAEKESENLMQFLTYVAVFLRPLQIAAIYLKSKRNISSSDLWNSLLFSPLSFKTQWQKSDEKKTKIVVVQQFTQISVEIIGVLQLTCMFVTLGNMDWSID